MLRSALCCVILALSTLVWSPAKAWASSAALSYSEGCGQEGVETGLRQISIRVGANTRSMLRVVANDYDATRPHALVIGYHGYGLDGNSPRQHHQWNLVEDMAGDAAIFIYANSLGPSWNGRSNSPDVLFFDEIIKQTAATLCVDTARVFVHGFSNGSQFVNSLVGQRPSSIRGVISVAGAGGGNARIPVMIIHGTTDGTIAYGNGQQSVGNYARSNACKTPVDFARLPMDQCTPIEGCPEDAPVVFCPWGGNHHWPAFTLAPVWQMLAAE